MTPGAENPWQNCFDETINEVLYHEFKRNAEALTVTVLRAETGREAAGMVVSQIKKLKVKQVASTPLSLLGDHVTVIGKYAASADVDFSLRLDRDKIELAEIGISQFEMGIAQLGSIFQDATDLHRRLVSMLPPVHIALIPTRAMVKTFADALEMIDRAYNGSVPPYLSFITGPSKTADIERELTIGVHGPGQLIVLCIDNEENH
jgi:L-lactate dehydrogenase complex protein LldG